MDRVSLFLLGFVTESYSRENGLKSFVLKLVTGSLPYKNRSLRLGNTLPEQRRNVTNKVHSGTTVGAASRESLGSVQEPPGWEGTHFGQGDGAAGQPSRRALLRGRHAREEEHGLDAAQCSLPGKNGSHRLHLLFFSFKAEMSCSSCPGAVHTGDTTFTKQYPLAAPRFFISIHLSSHPSLCRCLIQKGKTSVWVCD